MRAISKYFGLGIDEWEPPGIELPVNPVIEIDGYKQSEFSVLAEAILSTFKIENDDQALRDNPHLFEQLRGDYPVRREFSFYSIRAKNIEFGVSEKLRKPGFNIIGSY